ncbi:DUF2586 family protein [Aeromonas salmonicida subsp. salmonicida]|uniref:DUF2586 family protein n=1 Tax=Aeromonas salmonicida TaxID=645 RepID=UPI002301DD5B|nr:DUF2586 family protein [Aeromonas salmonicida]WCB50283.1 DUF2586 family protein [Aeromonas salmonicida subsp. salmonicida]
MLLAVPGIVAKAAGKNATAQDWSEYEAALAALQDGIKADSVGLVPQLWPNLIGGTGS